MGARIGTIVASLASAALCFLAIVFIPELTFPRALDGGLLTLSRFDAADLIPGLVFGVLVLASRDVGRGAAIVLIALSGIIHLLARETALTLHSRAWPAIAACALAGALAAFILSVLYARLAHRVAAWKNNLRSAAIGGFAGIVIGLALRISNDLLAQTLVFSGYAVWQMGFALLHGIVPRWWPCAPRKPAPAIARGAPPV